MKVGDLVVMNGPDSEFHRAVSRSPYDEYAYKMPGLVMTIDDNIPPKWVTVYWPSGCPWTGMSANDPNNLEIICSK